MRGRGKEMETSETRLVVTSLEADGGLLLPPLLAHNASESQKRVKFFYGSVHEIFERWVTRSGSVHTQKAYRTDVMAFVTFMGWRWSEDSWQFLTATIAQVSAWRDAMLEEGKAPKTMSRRLASLSSFYKFLGACAAEARLPITVPNPAHAQFIRREGTDPLHETKALSAAQARKLMAMPEGDGVCKYRDRAILKVLLYTGVRIGTLRRMNVSHFHADQDNPTLTLIEKGNKRRTIGIHIAASDALREYIEEVGLTSGALFRAQAAPHNSKTLSEKRISMMALWMIVRGYLEKLPGAMRKELVYDEEGNSKEVTQCIYTPHSLRATTATLLLDSGVDITKVQQLLGHKSVTTTQIYDKRRRSTKESASHEMPL